jgi:hypothetical protein
VFFQVAADESARIVDFYKTISGLSFTLLGLWWIVIQARFADGRGTTHARRHAYGVMLFFLLPGVMSLFSIVDDSTQWWRLVFGISGLLGLIEIVLHWASARERMTASGRALRLVGFIIYVMVFVVALYPSRAVELLDVRALAIEAVLSGILVIIGIHLAFQAITETPPKHA